MTILIGVVLALIVAGFAAISRFDRERSFYPTVLIVVASYYLLFAAIAANALAIGVALAGLGVFTTVAVAGFRQSLWIVVAALAGHGLLDASYARILPNMSVPTVWPDFCAAFDVAAALCLGFRMVSSGRQLGAPRQVVSLE